MTLTTGTLTLTKKRDLAPRVFELTFQADQPLAFAPGQFFMLHFPTPQGEVKRPYSCASLPSQKELVLLVKLMPDGVASAAFETMQPGATVKFSGPYGKFKLDPAYAGPLLFIVTGTGVAPVWSILQDLVESGRKLPVHMLLGVVGEQDAFYPEEFEAMRKRHPFTYTICVEKPSDGYAGARGFVTAHITQPPVPFDPLTANAFICGNPIMVKAAADLLKERGWKPEQIHVEKFS